MTDELGSPLGKKKRKKFNIRFSFGSREWPVGRFLFLLSGLIVGGFFLRVFLVDDPTGGKPITEVSINSTLNANSIVDQVSSSPQDSLGQNPLDSPPLTPGSSGPNSSFIISNQPATPQVIPNISAEISTEINAVERDKMGNFPFLVENTQNGPIPRISLDGQTPFNAYSRPSIQQQSAAGKPLVAIVITGMGINEGTTLEAISTLPDNVTLAFAPYGRTLERTTAAARAGGHEIMLEIPMEPFDYPNSDPGPQTLLTGFPPKANLDRLFWLMARAGGYMGMINNLGARFTSSAADLAPFMEELGSRGIGYLDDGSSNRSLSRQLANANQVPFGRATLLIDQNPSRSAILSQLQKLLETARSEGTAIGVISALPISINTIASWSAQLGEQNVELVPVSALMQIANQ